LWYRDAGLRGREAFLALFTVFITYGLMGAAVSAQTIIIPTLTVSETYDSNVFNTPKSTLPPGSKPEDFITTVTPMINVAHTGSLIRGNLSGGALVTRYLENHDLNYIGVNASGRLDLLQLAKKEMSQRITTLAVTGSYQLTPSMSQFGATSGQFGGNFGATPSSALNSGIVTNRVSVNTANLGIAGGYLLTRTTSLTGSYNYTTVFFGTQSGGVNNQLFDTTGHTGTITMSTRLNPMDTVGTTASISHYTQSQGSNGGQGSFTTPSGTINWTRMWTPKLNTALAGGAILILPIASTVPGQSVKTEVAPTATASINYSSFSQGLRAAGSAAGPFEGLPALYGSLYPGGLVPAGQYRASLNSSYSIYPSTAYGAGALKALVVGTNVSGGITPKLSGQAGMNFAHGSSTASSTNFTYDTVGVTVGARYLLGPILASLTYNWLYSSNSNSTSQPSLGQGTFAFSKNMVLLALSYAFTSQSFFRMDTFGYVGTPDSVDGTSVPSGTGAGSGPSSSGPGNLKE
jgi:hypothetical protein